MPPFTLAAFFIHLKSTSYCQSISFLIFPFFCLSFHSFRIHYLPLPSPLTLKCNVISVHYSTFTNTPTEMELKGRAKPIVIIIITVISYYPPPCLPVAESKVPGVQVGHGARMPSKSQGTIRHLAIHVKPPSIWKAEFVGWIQRWSRIWIRRLVPSYVISLPAWNLISFQEGSPAICMGRLKAFLHRQIQAEWR